MRCGVITLAAIALGALGPSRGALADQSAPAHYVYEIWYEVERGMSRQFDEYFATLKEKGPQIAGPERWVDAHPESNRRLVSLPAAHLDDYRSERYNETGLRAILGEAAYGDLFKSYTDAQISRKSYIRQYRTDLSFNRHHHTREGIWATEYTLVTVEPGKEKQFERLWLTALDAYAKISSQAIFTVAKTLVGGGPQYVVIRPLKTPADLERVPAPAQAVEEAFGLAEARAFATELRESVNKWDRLVLAKTDLDSDDAGSERRFTR